MNNQLIEKVIKSNDLNSCPEFCYENPLLDRNVAGALARSFVKILSVSQQDSNINNNLRHSVLANIRKLCRTQPENHLELDENFTKSLTELYMDKARITLTEDCKNCVERSLDEFLIRTMKDVDLKSNYQTSMNPEVVQALLNLSDSYSNPMPIFKNVLHWCRAEREPLYINREMAVKVKDGVNFIVEDHLVVNKRLSS